MTRTATRSGNGLRQRVIETLDHHGVPRAHTEIRTCGWLAQVDENGGNIFSYRPHSKGAEDTALLVGEVMELLRFETPTQLPVEVATADTSGGLSTNESQQHEAA